MIVEHKFKGFSGSPVPKVLEWKEKKNVCVDAFLKVRLSIHQILKKAEDFH